MDDSGRQRIRKSPLYTDVLAGSSFLTEAPTPDRTSHTREVPLFLTRALAEGFKAELMHAANAGLPFDPETGLPFAWTPEPEPPPVTWYEHALAFVDMKWPQIAANSRVSIAEGLATVTPCLVADRPGAPPPEVLRAALYGWAFNTTRRQTTEPDADKQKALDWLTAVSLPVSDLNDLAHIRHASRNWAFHFPTEVSDVLFRRAASATVISPARTDNTIRTLSSTGNCGGRLTIRLLQAQEPQLTPAPLILTRDSTVEDLKLPCR